MSEEVRTVFSIDSKQYFTDLAKIEKRLRDVTRLESTLGKGVTGASQSGLNQLVSGFDRLEKRLTAAQGGAVSLGNQLDRLAKTSRGGGMQAIARDAEHLKKEALNVGDALRKVNEEIRSSKRTGSQSSLKLLTDEAAALERRLVLVKQQTNSIRGADIRRGAPTKAAAPINVDRFAQQLNSAQQRAVSLAGSFDKLSRVSRGGVFNAVNRDAERFKATALGLQQRLARVSATLSKRPTGIFLTQLEAQSKRLTRQLETLRGRLQQIRGLDARRGFGGRGGGASFNSPLLSGVTGGLIGGGVAGTAIVATQALKRVLRGLTEGLVDVGQASLKASGDFEITTNSMIVFTGNAVAARVELAKIAEVARATPGLGLKEAEASVKQLQALGFSSLTAEQFSVGLAKQKLLSGVTDATAIQRAIVNITQIGSGSPRVSQDIKELIQNLPTVRLNLIKTFGSLEQFKSALKRDPQGTLEKFAEGLENTVVPAAGLNDAIIKLQDAWLKALRAFGEPGLDTITSIIHALTNALEENKDKFREWGEDVANILAGLQESGKNVGAESLLDLPGQIVGGGAKILELDQNIGANIVDGARRIVDTLDLQGRIRREREEAALPADERLLRQRERDTEGFIDDIRKDPKFRTLKKSEQRKAIDQFLEDSGFGAEQFSAEELLKTNQINAAIAKLKDLEQAQKEVATNEQSTFKLREAQLGAFLKRTQTDEVTALRQTTTLKNQLLQEQASREIANLEKQIQIKKVIDPESEDIKALQGEARSALIRVQSEIQANLLTADAEIHEILRKTAIEFKDFARDALIAKQDNPFIDLFVNAEDAARDAFEKFKVFGAGFANEASKIARAAQQAIIDRAQFDSIVKAGALRQEARGLSRLLPEQINGFERRLASLQSALGFIETAQGQRISARLDRAFGQQVGQAGFDPQQVQDEELKRQLSLFSRNTRSLEAFFRRNEFGDLGIFGEEAVARSQLSLLPSTQDLLRLGGQGENVSGFLEKRARLQEIQAEANDKRVLDELERLKFANLAQQDVWRDIEVLNTNRNLTNRPQFLDSIINATANIGELPPALVAARIDVLNERANIEEGRKNEAHAALLRLDANVSKWVNGGVDKSLVRIINEAPNNAKIEQKAGPPASAGRYSGAWQNVNNTIPGVTN